MTEPNNHREEEICACAKQAAKETVQEFWVTLGVDVTNPQNMLELQADLRHARYMRQLSGKVGNETLNLIIKAVVGGAIIVLAYQLFGIHIEKFIN